MKTCNVKIDGVTIRGNFVRMFFQGCDGFSYLKFNRTNAIGNKRIDALLNYAGVQKIGELDGKIIREATCDENNLICGFGDPIHNKFMPLFGEHCHELDEDQLQMLVVSSPQEVMRLHEDVYGDD